MTTTPILDRQKGQLDRSALLGRIMWYTVPSDTMLDFGKVVSDLTNLSLTKALPKFPEDHNTFRRAITDAQLNKVPHAGHPDQFENWMTRDVAGRNEQVITKRIVVEIVDPKGKKLDYQQVADIEFERPVIVPDRSAEFNAKIAEIEQRINELSPTAHTRRTQLLEYKLNVTKRRDACPTPVNRPARMKFIWLNGYTELTHPTAKDIWAEVNVNFKRWQGKLNDQALREWIRKTILAMGATCIRPSGGIYFLEERYADQVEALEKFVADNMPGGICHSVEIPDNDKQREMIKRAVEDETIGEIERMMAQVATVRKEGHLTEKAYINMITEVRELQAKMGNYTQLLEKDLSAVHSRLQVLDMQTRSLAPLKGSKPRKKKGGQ